MFKIRSCPVPDAALLHRYAQPARSEHAGAYTDCFRTRVAGQYNFDEYVFAFYTTWLFRMERAILGLVRRPSTDAQAQALANGSAEAFAAWTVEAREPGQLLLCDVSGSTRSWLMCEPVNSEGATDLYFGSAVVPPPNKASGPGAGMKLLLPAHRFYSRALLGAARSRLIGSRGVE